MDNGGGGISGGGSGAVETGGVWGGFVVEGDGLFGIIVVSVVVHIIGFYFSVPIFCFR